VAASGAVVSVAAGSYSNQPDLDLARAVTFRASGTVSLSGTHPSLWETGSGFTLDGFSFPNGFYIRPGAHDITVSHFTTLDAYIMSASDIVWADGQIRGQNNNDGGQIKSSGEGGTIPSNITLSNVSVHDVTRTDGSSHTDCLQVGAVNGMLVERSRFYSCATQGLFFDPIFGTDSIRNVTVRNSFFGTVPQGSRNLVFGAIAGPVTVAYNSFGSANVGGGTASNNISFVGNIGGISSCSAWGSGVSFAYDQWKGASCSNSDRSVNPSQLSFVSEAGNDLHIGSSSSALGAVPVASCAAADGVDIDDSARPSAVPCDAGADYYTP
jgi:hypothetical protein